MCMILLKLSVVMVRYMLERCSVGWLMIMVIMVGVIMLFSRVIENGILVFMVSSVVV